MSVSFFHNECIAFVGGSQETRFVETGTAPYLPSVQLGCERYYDESDIKKALGIPISDKKVVVYCRVSSANQKDDLTS